MNAPQSSRYQVLGHLARGGMGEILLARRLGPAGFEKLVVLKRPLEAIGSRSLVTALIEEARLLARINHPNVCQVLDLEEADGQFFLALEYLEGLSLWTMLTAHKRIEPRILCALFEQACDGLDAIHHLCGSDDEPIGAVHRDISPGNLFLTDAGTLKLLDLGIAKSTDSEERTPFGHVKGKFSYISPEQARGKGVDARSDLFSLGLTLYDLARGEEPTSERIGAMMADALELDGLPAPLVAIISRSVTEEPGSRFASAREMAQALREAGAALGGSASRTELAEWVAREFATELAGIRAMRRTFIEEGCTQPATTVRTLTLRSVIATDASNIVTALTRRQTEQLSQPDVERLRPSAPSTELLAMAVIPSGTAPAPRGGWRWVAVGAMALIAVTTSTLWLTARNAPTTDRAQSQAQLDPEPQAAMQPQPQPQPATQSESQRATQPESKAQAQPKSAPQTEPRPERAVHVRPVKKPVADKPIATGTLTVHSDPYAVIRVGAQNLGTTTLWRVPIKAGRYTLHAETSDGRILDRSIVIEANEETKVGLDWSSP